MIRTPRYHNTWNHDTSLGGNVWKERGGGGWEGKGERSEVRVSRKPENTMRNFKINPGRTCHHQPHKKWQLLVHSTWLFDYHGPHLLQSCVMLLTCFFIVPHTVFAWGKCYPDSQGKIISGSVFCWTALGWNQKHPTYIWRPDFSLRYLLGDDPSMSRKQLHVPSERHLSKGQLSIFVLSHPYLVSLPSLYASFFKFAEFLIDL